MMTTEEVCENKKMRKALEKDLWRFASKLSEKYSGGCRPDDCIIYGAFRDDGTYYQLYEEIVIPTLREIFTEARWECEGQEIAMGLRLRGDSIEPGTR